MPLGKNLSGVGLPTKSERPKGKLMNIKWSGVTSCLEQKFNPAAEVPPYTPKGVRKVWLLDAQWSTCPIEVYEQVQLLWQCSDLGNDNYIYKTTINDLVDDECSITDAIVQYLREMGVDEEDEVLIHYWW